MIEREQFYIDKYKPEYNILKVAGSSYGFRHSEASKELISQLAKGRRFSTETLLKMKERTILEEVKLIISVALKGRGVSQRTRKLMSVAASGRKRNQETLLKMALNNNKRQPIILTNLESGIYKKFLFIKDAAEYLATSHTQIRNYLKKNKPYKGYTISLGVVKE